MEAYKISVKLFVANDVFGHSEFVPVFHRWIQEHVLDDHLLIDVADYAHVPDGPGTLLVTHEANIHMDREAGRLGLLYFRKTPIAGSFAERLRGVLASILKVASLLEQEPAVAGKLKFKTDELLIRLHDRLIAPNTPATLDAVRGDVQTVADELYGASHAKITSYGKPDQLFGVLVKSTSSAGVSDLAKKLALVPA